MKEHVSNDPLERLVARFGESGRVDTSENVAMPLGDPMERLGAWIKAACDLSTFDETGIDGVLGELLERIESAHAIKPFTELELRVSNTSDPRATIGSWIADECAALGSMPAIVRVRAAGDKILEHGSGVYSERSDGSVEAAVGRAVLSMVGEIPLSAQSRREAVALLASALEQPSPQALQAVFRILIAGE